MTTSIPRQVAHIRKYVVVVAPKSGEAMIDLSELVMPVETKTFDLADEQAAWAWLAKAQSATS